MTIYIFFEHFTSVYICTHFSGLNRLWHIRGLNPPGDKQLKVVFHVLVHQPIWEWDAESQMFVRFGNPELGNFQYDYGPFKVDRYV